MGNSTGKFVINNKRNGGDNTAAVAAGKDTATDNAEVVDQQINGKEVVVNGNGTAEDHETADETQKDKVDEAITKEPAVTDEAIVTETTPEGEEATTDETAVPKKKRNPIHWLSKKFSVSREQRKKSKAKPEGEADVENAENPEAAPTEEVAKKPEENTDETPNEESKPNGVSTEEQNGTAATLSEEVNGELKQNGLTNGHATPQKSECVIDVADSVETQVKVETIVEGTLANGTEVACE